jgi:hypothetical protein
MEAKIRKPVVFGNYVVLSSARKIPCEDDGFPFGLYNQAGVEIAQSI